MLNDWRPLTGFRSEWISRTGGRRYKSALEPLLEKRSTITAEYLTAIFAQREKFGPYFVLAPGIAMPHARPEEGAKGLGLSLLTLPQGVTFNSEDNDPVYTVVMLSAPDKHSHIELISELAELFSSDEAYAENTSGKRYKNNSGVSLRNSDRFKIQ